MVQMYVIYDNFLIHINTRNNILFIGNFEAVKFIQVRRTSSSKKQSFISLNFGHENRGSLVALVNTFAIFSLNESKPTFW